jgi:hypothetical protein
MVFFIKANQSKKNKAKRKKKDRERYIDGGSAEPGVVNLPIYIHNPSIVWFLGFD